VIPKIDFRRPCSRVVVVLLLTVATGAAAGLAETLPIVERAIEFHGGETFRASEVALRITSKSGSFEIVARHDGDLFVHRVTSERDEERVVYRQTNDSIEVSRDGEVVLLETEQDRQRARDFVSARVYFAFLPFRLTDPSVMQEDEGLERWGDRELHRVKVTFEPGSSTNADDAYLYWFDPESGRLEQFAYSFSGGVRFRTLENYRRVGGILFADQKNYAVDVGALGIDRIDPAWVESEMELLSIVRFEEIDVRALP
jgi:hypothetical protein